MSRRRRGNAFFDIATKAPQVIAYRTALAGTPGPRLMTETVRMVAEKQAAAMESFAAMGFALLQAQQQWLLGAMLNPRGAALSPGKVIGTAQRIAARGAKPVQRRVNANARRLRSRRGKRHSL